MRKFLSVSLILLVILLVPACFPSESTPETPSESSQPLSQPSPERTIERLGKALNDMDAEAALSCFEPSIQTLMKLFLGNDIDSIFGMILRDYVDEEAFANPQELYQSISMEVQSVEYLADKTEATVNLEITYRDKRKTAPIDLIKNGEEWYIKVNASDYL